MKVAQHRFIPSRPDHYNLNSYLVNQCEGQRPETSKNSGPYLQTAASSAMRCARRARRHKGWGALALFETKGNPTLKTLLAVIKSVGMGMSVEPEIWVQAQIKLVAGQDPKPSSARSIW